ncbi:MAG: ABC transporter permease [Nitrospinae bacterium]|nr:ABC transporter permease [Nitrospinota bacterium]
MLIRLAWRNIWRNTRRSLITLSAISFGLTVLIFLWGFGDGAHERMVENFISISVGHLQIHTSGYLRSEDPSLTIPQWREKVERLQGFPEVYSVSPRIRSHALVATPTQSSGVLLSGVLPDTEIKVTRLLEFISKGRFLSPEPKGEVVIGEDFARFLNVSIGERIVILTQGFNGSLASGSYEVAGLFRSGVPEIDRGQIFLHLKTVQELLSMPDEVHELTIRLKSSSQLEDTRFAMSRVFPSAEYEIQTWIDLSPMVVQWIELDNIILYIILLVVTIIVSIGIMNAMLMTVFERFKEFGILRAMGTMPHEILLMILLEAAMLTLLGTIAGIIMGFGLDRFYGWHGINLSEYSHAFANFYSGTVIYTHVSVKHLLQSAGIVFIAGILSSIYPAIKAVRLQPVEAIRYV